MSSLYYYLKLFLMLLCLTTTECKPVLREKYNSYPDVDGELIFYYYPATWDDAQKICAEEGAVLASPSDEGMKQALDDLGDKTRNVASMLVYTGVKKLTRQYFYSIEGVPLDKMPVTWLPGEPNNKANQEDCIAYANGSIAGVRCSERLPFLCYLDHELTRPDDCPEGYKFVSFYNKCYKLHDEPLPWGETDDACRAEGGQLAKYLVPKPLGSSKVVPWAHVLNVISEYFDFFKENVIFISFVDENNRNWMSYYTNVSEYTPCAALRIHRGVKVITHGCNHTAPFLCESSKVITYVERL